MKLEDTQGRQTVNSTVRYTEDRNENKQIMCMDEYRRVQKD